MLFFTVNTTKIAYFSKIYNHAKFQDLTLIAASIAPTS